MKEIKNIQEYNELLNGSKPVLLDFYAEWCGPCKMLLPIVEELSEKHSDDFEIVKINVDNNPEIAQIYNVRSIPTLVFVSENEVKEKLTGLQSKHVLDQKIHEYIATPA